jgi:hypothetical protein
MSSNPQTMKHIPFLALTIATLPLLVSRNENQMIAKLSNSVGVIEWDSDPNVDFDVRVPRHNRGKAAVFFRADQTLVLLFIPYQVWSTWERSS